jgi:SSS family solute:Na+ symporter
VITTFSAVLNSTVALYSVDFHDQFIGKVKDHWKLGTGVSTVVTIAAVALVPVYENPQMIVDLPGEQSIINLLQQLNGLASMPILSAFIAGLLYRNVGASAAIVGVLWGVLFYGLYTFWWNPDGIITLHYIHFMVIVLLTSVLVALGYNRLVLGNRAQWIGLAEIRGQA